MTTNPNHFTTDEANTLREAGFKVNSRCAVLKNVEIQKDKPTSFCVNVSEGGQWDFDSDWPTVEDAIDQVNKLL